MTKRPVTCLLGIDYEDGPNGYRAVTLAAPGGEPIRYASGDPVKDWATATADARKMVESGHALACSMKSSCVRFVFDVPGYRFNDADDLELDPLDWTDGVLTPFDYGEA